MTSDNDYGGWKKSKLDIFWGEIAPCDHVLQIYENDEVFLNALAGFVGDGINSGDSCIIIATDIHLEALEKKLENYGVHVRLLAADNRYIPLNAKEMLSRFMVNGWPDETLFMHTVSEILKEARSTNHRRIRAFGEMVAILWEEDNNGATVHLEHLWNKFCQQDAFCLFCAYPKSAFTEDINNSMDHICNAHSKMIGGSQKQLAEVFYKETQHRKAI